MIWGGTIFGNCASGSPRTAMMPTITMMIEITIATMGRLTKKLEIMARTSPIDAASAQVGLGPANVGSVLAMVELAQATIGPAQAMVGPALGKTGLHLAKAPQTVLD